MKKYLAFLFAILMLAMAGCGHDDGEASTPPANDSKAPVSDTQKPEDPADTDQPASSNNKVVDYKIDVPDSFEEIEQEGLDACWFNGADQSNINLTITEKDSTTDLTFKTLSADLMRATLKSAFEEQGLKVTLTDRYFIKDDVCGLPAYQYSYVVEMDGGQQMTQIMVGINADKTYAFTYTTSSSEMVPVFEESSKNIELIFG